MSEMWVIGKQVLTPRTGVSTSSTVEGEISSPASLADQMGGHTDDGTGHGTRALAYCDVRLETFCTR